MDLTYAEKWLREGNIPQVCKELGQQFPNEVRTGRIRELVSFALDQAARPVQRHRSDRVFLNCIEETKKLLRGAPPRNLRHLSIGAELDFLSDREGVEGWTAAQCVSYLLLGEISPRRKSIVVTSMRDDGIYILQWIAHYLALGFEHIVIYTNDNADGSEELLRLLAAHGIITLIESEITGTEEPEGKAYGHAIHLLHDLRDFEWALFVDSDEYFIPEPKYRNSVTNVLSAIQRRFPEQPPSGICYNWMWFISEMAFARSPELLIERFQHAEQHILTKSLARIPDILSMRFDHYPEVKPACFVVDSLFDPVDLSSMETRPPQYGGGRINHYWTRSFEEFSIKKARGATLKLPTNLYDRPYTLFFEWNGFETPANHFPPDPSLLRKVKKQLEELKGLEGIRAVSAKIERNFPAFLKRIAGKVDLHKLYENSKTAPTSL